MNFLNVNTASATLFAVVALVVWITIGYGRRRRARVLDRMCGPTMAERLTSTVHAGKRRWRLGIFLMAVGLLFVAAARPWWGKRLVPAPQRSRDIIIALDCSRSMLATDVAPSRLVHAKWVIRRLIERFPGDRFGLVAFSGDAFLECPLTQDRSTLFQFLDDIDSDTIGLGGTNLERALTVAQEAFGGAEGGNQAVILVTDGDELQGNAERSIKTYREQETAIHFIGIGDPAQGAVVKTENNEFLRDKKGDLVTSRLDELRLRTLASRADGAYVRSTAVHPRLEPITETLDKLVPERKDAMANMRPVERFQLPLALAVICLILRFFIGQRKTVSSGALIALVAAVCVFGGGATAADSDAVTSERAPQIRKQLEETEKKLATVASEDRARLLYNAGVLLQELGDFDKAEERYREALDQSSVPRTVEALVLWNLGLVKQVRGREALADRGEPGKALTIFQEAERYYREALQLQPGVEELARNQEQLRLDLERAEYLLELRDAYNQKLKRAREKTADALSAQEKANTSDNLFARQEALAQAFEHTSEAHEAAETFGSFLEAHPELNKADGENIGQLAAGALADATDAQKKAAQKVRTDVSRLQLMNRATASLVNALRLLGGQYPGQQPQEGGQDKQQKEGEQEGQEKGGQPKQAESGPQDQPADSSQGGGVVEQLGQQEGESEASEAIQEVPEGSFDQDQAESLIIRMQPREQDLGDALKTRRQQHMKTSEPEKNW